MRNIETRNEFRDGKYLESQRPVNWKYSEKIFIKLLITIHAKEDGREHVQYGPDKFSFSNYKLSISSTRKQND